MNKHIYIHLVSKFLYGQQMPITYYTYYNGEIDKRMSESLSALGCWRYCIKTLYTGYIIARLNLMHDIEKERVP